MATLRDLEPFGHMAAPFAALADRGLAPGAWKGVDYKQWVGDMTRRLADTIWPRWDGTGWSGAAATDAVIALTAADLELMSTLSGRHDGSARLPGGVSNADWFAREDRLFEADWTSRYNACFGGCGVSMAALVGAMEQGALDTFCGSIPWLLKAALQRPRANQVAFWLGKRRPRVEMAATALSPSAPSGHAFQGLVGCMNVALRFGLADPYDARLQHLAVDIGDRRVFAGIHYPSDNVMSWITAFEALPYLAADKGEQSRMLAFLRAAIGSSEVYLAMGASAGHAACISQLERYLNAGP